MKTILKSLAVLAVAGSATWLIAQGNLPPPDGPGGPGAPGGPGGRGGPGGPGMGGHRPPPPPIIAALDANHDGVIDAEEIANASKALKTLDKNGDGKLTPDELRPPRPEGHGQDGPPQDGPGGPGGPDGPGGPGGPGMGGHRPPPPIIAALDANHDGVIDADEIANASKALKALDKNGDGKLTPDELRPPRPEGHGQDGPPPRQ